MVKCQNNASFFTHIFISSLIFFVLSLGNKFKEEKHHNLRPHLQMYKTYEQSGSQGKEWMMGQGSFSGWTVRNWIRFCGAKCICKYNATAVGASQ